MTDLDRGTLAKIDRKVLSGLGHDKTWQMVRVPVSEAEWSAWKPYCDALGISMGRAMAALMRHELRSIVGDVDDGPVFLAELETAIAKRQRVLDAGECNLEIRDQRVRTEGRTHDLVASQPLSDVTKVGRNDPCPCGSGVKYKRCHGC